MTFHARPTLRRLAPTAVLAALALACGLAAAHGDVTPQAVDTKDLPPLGEQWRAENPYRQNDTAIKIGSGDAASIENPIRIANEGISSTGATPQRTSSGRVRKSCTRMVRKLMAKSRLAK